MVKNIFKKSAALWVYTCMFTPITAFARDGSGTTLESILQRMIDYATGDVARAAGVLAITIAGYLFLFKHQIEKSTFITIAVAMAIILGGSTLADEFWG